MTNANKPKAQARWTWIAAFLAVAAVMAMADASTANARTFVSLRVGVPLYAGPPAYYAPYPAYYYAPAPVYYAPPPAIVVPTPAAASCRTGLWRQQDGSVVNGVACLQPNGLWQLTHY